MNISAMKLELTKLEKTVLAKANAGEPNYRRPDCKPKNMKFKIQYYQPGCGWYDTNEVIDAENQAAAASAAKRMQNQCPNTTLELAPKGVELRAVQSVHQNKKENR